MEALKSFQIVLCILLGLNLSFGQTETKDSTRIYQFPDKFAEFPDGAAKLRRYLAKHIVYPSNALEMGLQGKCYASFVITDNGQVTNVTLKKGVPNCPECDMEAIRVIKLMPKWTPALVNGKPVNSIFNLPITFIIKQSKKKSR